MGHFRNLWSRWFHLTQWMERPILAPLTLSTFYWILPRKKCLCCCGFDNQFLLKANQNRWKNVCFFRQDQTMTSLHDQEHQSPFSFSLWSSIVFFFFFLSPQCLGSEYVNIDRNSSPVTISTFPTGQILSANQNCFSSLACLEVTGFSAVT